MDVNNVCEYFLYSTHSWESEETLSCLHGDLLSRYQLLRQRESESIKVEQLDDVDVGTNSINKLTLQLKAQDVGKPHNCLHCEKRFKTKQQLKVHTITHTGEKPYSCIHCEKKFSQNRQLNAHIATQF